MAAKKQCSKMIERLKNNFLVIEEAHRHCHRPAGPYGAGKELHNHPRLTLDIGGARESESNQAENLTVRNAE